MERKKNKNKDKDVYGTTDNDKHLKQRETNNDTNFSLASTSQTQKAIRPAKEILAEYDTFAQFLEFSKQEKSIEVNSCTYTSPNK